MAVTTTHGETIERLRRGMAAGVLAFPLTALDAGGRIALDAYRAHLRSQLAAGPGALFPCCGTGEFFSLAEDEYEQLVTAAVQEAAGTVPVVVGAGYGWAQAARFAAIAERAGADALLLLPPYLVETPPRGLVEHVRRVAASTALPLIVYQRAQVRIEVADAPALAAIPGVIGVKDGHCDLDRLQRIKLAAPEDWLFFNGAATAEMQARAYRAIGVPAYSSAVHAFAPEISRAFFTALHAEDHERVDRLLEEFYMPFVELRDRGTGYAVSLVKAAARLRGANVGPVRAPLMDPAPRHLEELDTLLTTGLALVGATR
ncbi:5-dehydro-4-deoxyglucarate dehydratase [Actinomadura rugatobispora]|uniref:Probable 5-dehydro-4-deoxyglucarate dehydratase n=1 Tax=Actinomadura rugatobispora TaxID=1994 RepID=A0ABW1ADB6_9ACTN|nr:5-dehydro-4-deoxyglucarate dehydratase [Actinomadura rugatobispora]